MRRLVVVVVASVALSGAVIGVAMADPGLNDIGAHRHFINGREVGPRLCDNPKLQNAFNQFHDNHHSHAVTDGQGPVAPGLHNGRGAELTAGGC